MDAGLQPRFEGDGIDRAPAAAIRDPRRLGDAPGPLRRDDIGHRRLMVAEFGPQHPPRDIDFGHLATHRQRDVFQQPGIERRPGLLEQLLLGKNVLRIQHHQLGARLMRLQVMRDQAGTFIGAGRAAEGIGGHRHDHQPAILHRLQLAAQQQGLGTGFPGMRHDFGRRLVVAGQRVEP
jgi:hypothetical protein